MKTSAEGAFVPSLATQSHLRDLEAIIRSRTPLITVETNEEPKAVALVREIGRRLQIKTFRWSVTEGMRAFDACDQPVCPPGFSPQPQGPRPRAVAQGYRPQP
jgi:hypothetical protein